MISTENPRTENDASLEISKPSPRFNILTPRVRPAKLAGLLLECAKIPRYVAQKNEARKIALPGLFSFEPGFTSTLYGGGHRDLQRG